jgi:hypothetical protein
VEAPSMRVSGGVVLAAALAASDVPTTCQWHPPMQRQFFLSEKRGLCHQKKRKRNLKLLRCFFLIGEQLVNEVIVIMEN